MLYNNGPTLTPCFKPCAYYEQIFLDKFNFLVCMKNILQIFLDKSPLSTAGITTFWVTVLFKEKLSKENLVVCSGLKARLVEHSQTFNYWSSSVSWITFYSG